MNKNKLGSSDLYITELGLGCMSLGTDENKAINLIHEAVDCGINYLDTADLYDFGVNEELVGKAIQGKRQDLIIATKVGNHWETGKEDWFWDPSKNYIKNQVKASLTRLQTDYIDLYQLHGGTIADPIDETIEAFEELRTEGLIRYYGISSIRPNVIREYVKRSNIVSVMMQYNLLDRRPEEDVFNLLKENDISILSRGPLAKGLLTEHFKDKAQKFKQRGYLDYSYEEAITIVSKIKQVLPNRRLEDVALHYSLTDPVSATIPGPSSIEQLRENVRALESSSLSKDEIETIQGITKEVYYTSHR